MPNWAKFEDAMQAARAAAAALSGPVSLMSFNKRWYLEVYRPEHEVGTNVVVVRPEQKEREQ